jgi:ferredoxin
VVAAREVGTKAAQAMGRSLDTNGVRDLLYANTEHPQWDDVASRCLSCTNCTLVCPTCFCTSIDDVSDLTGSTTERWQVWDSCFTTDFSYLHGGSVRTSAKSRYRQWATHKLASWMDQFGTSGCVGCGRCIAWCPAAIDLTAEVAAIRSGKE